MWLGATALRLFFARGWFAVLAHLLFVQDDDASQIVGVFVQSPREGRKSRLRALAGACRARIRADVSAIQILVSSTSKYPKP